MQDPQSTRFCSVLKPVSQTVKRRLTHAPQQSGFEERIALFDQVEHDSGIDLRMHSAAINARFKVRTEETLRRTAQLRRFRRFNRHLRSRTTDSTQLISEILVRTDPKPSLGQAEPSRLDVNVNCAPGPAESI